MTTVAESIGNNSQLQSTLANGLSMISESATITFTKYIKKILPLDGYVFWLQGEQTSIQGSFHYATTMEQNEDETVAVNSVAFTTTTPVDVLGSINNQILYIANFRGNRFVFSTRGMFYEQAGLYHYSGRAVFSALASQLVNSLYDIPPTNLIVSNSLPAWLALQSYSPAWLTIPNPAIQLYPSFLVPTNILPPYGSVHIEPSRTNSIQAAPRLTINGSHYQLATDNVRITLYGLNNAQALDFLDTVNQYSLDTDVFGIMNIPTMRDEKRTQVELQAIAMKKTIEFDVSYYQTRINDVARQLIEKAFIQYTVVPLASVPV
jgi:hypothetical protein